VLICIGKIGRTCRSVPFNTDPWSRVRDQFGDQNVRSTFAGFSLCGEVPNAGERGSFYAVGFQMSRNSKKQKSNEDYDIQR